MGNIIIYGAGKYGKQYLEILGKARVLFFVDKNASLHDSCIDGVRIASFDELKSMNLEGIDVIIAAGEPWNQEIAMRLSGEGIQFYKNIEEYLLSFQQKKLEKYRNICRGESCFIIGSGPSLQIKDLEKIQNKGIATFAPNKIFKIFNETKWRPDYYVVTDRRIIEYYQDTIADLSINNKFVAYYGIPSLQKFYNNLKEQGAVLFRMKEANTENKYYDFSEDVGKYVIEGRTVIYAMMQIAVYMGFEKLYIIGVDFSYTDKTGYDKENRDHFCNNYIEKGEKVLITPREYALKAFTSAKEYGDENNIIILNATRGGALEVFDRVNIEEI